MLLIGVGFGASRASGQARSRFKSANLRSLQNTTARPQSQTASSLPGCTASGTSCPCSLQAITLLTKSFSRGMRVRIRPRPKRSPSVIVCIGAKRTRCERETHVQEVPTDQYRARGQHRLRGRLVEDNATYYAVTAVNADGYASAPSNEAIAHISIKNLAGSAAATSPPAPTCRAPSVASQ